MRKFLRWLGSPDDIINKLALDVMRANEGIESKNSQTQLPEFHTVPLPEDSVKFADIAGAEQLPQNMLDVAQYMHSRELYVDDYDFHWSSHLGYRDRLIIPFYYEGRVVGWTARKVKDGKPKYLSEQQPGYVFGLDNQGYHKEFVIVVEGPIDAIYVEGCALMGSEIKDQQALLLNRLGKEVIVVPDRDRAGSKLVEQALGHGWQVSMPDWSPDINDVGDCVARHGRLYTLYSIVQAAETSALKTRLRAKTWFG